MSNNVTPEDDISQQDNIVQDTNHSGFSKEEKSPLHVDYDQVDSYQPFIEELEELNQEFLLRNYATVWSGCLELIVKLIRLPSPVGTPTADRVLGSQNLLPMIEAWKSRYSPELLEPPPKLPKHVLISFHLWANAWSLLITLIGKWYEQTQTFNTRKNDTISSQEKPLSKFEAPNSGFSVKDIEAIEDRVYSMDRNLESIWECLSLFYYPDPHTIPSDLVLGITLIAVKQESFKTAEYIATTWLNAIPDSWKMILKIKALKINWDEDDSAEGWMEKFCLHYDSIMTLYIAHTLVGQERWKEAPVILNGDKVLPQERKFLITELLDQAWQEHETAHHQKKLLPVNSATALAAINQLNSSESPGTEGQSSNSEGHNHLASRDSSAIDGKRGFLFKYLHYFKDGINRTSSMAALSSALAIAVVIVWVSRRNKMKSDSSGIFSGGWGAYWLYRIFKSIRPALPSTSGGPDSL